MLEAIAGGGSISAPLERQDMGPPKRYVKALAAPSGEDAVNDDKHEKLERLMKSLSVRVDKAERRESALAAENAQLRRDQRTVNARARSLVVTRHSRANEGRNAREEQLSDGDGDDYERPPVSHSMRGGYGSGRGR